MLYRTSPKDGDQLSALGFGCMRFPDHSAANPTASDALVRAAIERGVNYFDTAYAYPGNEEILGTILARDGLRDRVKLATKLPHGKVRTAADFQAILDTSLRRLRTDHIDYYLIHNMVNLDQWRRLEDLGVREWIASQRESGRIRRIGFSFHGSATEFPKLVDAFGWDFCQIQYNYADPTYQAGRDGLRYAASKGLGVIIMEPLLGGKLADGMPPKALKVLREADPTRSAANWGLRWLWDQPEVTCVLSGMKTPGMVEDNCTAAEDAKPGCMSAGEHAVIDQVRAVFRETSKVGCTGCNYCMPCPRGINIPAAFTAYNASYAHGLMTGLQGHMMSVGAFGEHPGWTTNCIGCGACERKCPQHLPIRELLKQVHTRLEPPGTQAVTALVRKLRRR